MRLLLDTHIFLWWDSAPDRLPPRARVLCEDPENELLLSVASVWEMQIKRQLGKLSLQLSLAEMVASQQRVNRLTLLPIQVEHVLALEALPAHHKDPFDRLLLAQAKIEDAVLLTSDAVFERYGIPLAT